MLVAMTRATGRPGGWANRDFLDEVPRPPKLLERTAISVAVTAFTFFVMIAAVGHESHDCALNCHDGDGILPHEAGYAWTGYASSWQWQAQWALGVGSFGLAAFALFASTRRSMRRWALVANVLAVLCAVAWIAWAWFEPPIPS
jgi:hypothetical protein